MTMDSKVPQLVLSKEEDVLHEIQIIRSTMEENQSALQKNLALVRARDGRDWAIQNQALQTLQLTEAMKKLSLLTYSFALLSLMARFFNITFVEFPDTLHLWLWFAVMMSVVAISMLFLAVGLNATCRAFKWLRMAQGAVRQRIESDRRLANTDGELEGSTEHGDFLDRNPCWKTHTGQMSFHHNRNPPLTPRPRRACVYSVLAMFRWEPSQLVTTYPLSPPSVQWATF
ncbi:hypothetical protein BGZ63DRAFT_466732 [Mariannaea sp. PMI_226]|nr:hypothetical protein BGZ63DRAFT_466732 [Mariannaea sp. PMI_226]